MAARRRRRRVLGGLLLMAVALALLLGRGLGLLPTRGEPTAGDATAPVPAAPPGAAAAPPPQQPSGPGAARDPAAGDPAVGGMDDRTAALRSATHTALADGRLGAASSVLSGLPAPDRADLERLLRQGLDAAVQGLVAEVEAGEILAAHARLCAMLDTPSADVERAVEDAAAARGWPSLVGTQRGAEPAPPGEWLPQDRSVRARLPQGQLLRSRIVARSAAGATLRSAGPEGVTFPTVPWSRLEPDAATAGEAAELGFAALAADDVRLARLWCACGLSRSASAPAARLQRLRELLP